MSHLPAFHVAAGGGGIDGVGHPDSTAPPAENVTSLRFNRSTYVPSKSYLVLDSRVFLLELGKRYDQTWGDGAMVGKSRIPCPAKAARKRG